MTESILSRNMYLIVLRIGMDTSLTDIEPSQYTAKFRGECLNINTEESTGSSDKALSTTVNGTPSKGMKSWTSLVYHC